MGLLRDFDAIDLDGIGAGLHSFASELYPICRSITGQGIRQTFAAIGRRIPLECSEVPTGTPVFDWVVPQEWNIRDASIRDEAGRTIVDFHQHNLHVVNYSAPVRRKLSLEELRPHLHSLPDHPDWIPYRTTYYQKQWGFCLTHNQMQSLRDGLYEVCIDSTLDDGSLSYAECYLPGQTPDEVLISVHACHPSLANDNLSGLSVATALAEFLADRPRRYSFRFVFLPGTIGAITWLARNREAVERIRHGLVLTCVGDRGGFHYKKSRRGDAAVDRAMAHALRHCGEAGEVLDFSPYGYDERQYCSPGFNLPVGCLMRSVWGTFPEYHTSADNLDFIQPVSLARSLRLCISVIDILENNHTWYNQNPWCEPQLGRRGLYNKAGGASIGAEIHACLWVLNLSDGGHSLLDIAERSGLPFDTILEAAQNLREKGLLGEQAATDSKPIARDLNS